MRVRACVRVRARVRACGVSVHRAAARSARPPARPPAAALTKPSAPAQIDLTEYVEGGGGESDGGEGGDLVYSLHSVLVHCGDVHGGHYFVYIRPDCSTRWLKFNDEKAADPTQPSHTSSGPRPLRACTHQNTCTHTHTCTHAHMHICTQIHAYRTCTERAAIGRAGPVAAPGARAPQACAQTTGLERGRFVCARAPKGGSKGSGGGLSGGEKRGEGREGMPDGGSWLDTFGTESGSWVAGWLRGRVGGWVFRSPT